MRDFSLLSPLPLGTTVLEASAGTGKTHAIATLAARFLAEGRATIDELMVVTFSREASRELRSRLRRRFTELIEGGALVEGGRPLDASQRERLRTALLDYDRATIMTIHEFCQAMFAGLGILAEQDPGATLVEDAEPLLHQIAHDVYLGRYATMIRRPPFPFQDRLRRKAVEESGALRLAVDALFDPEARIVPGEAVGAVRERVEFATGVRAEARQRKQRSGLITFDDQLLRLRDTLADNLLGPAACERLRQRFRVVLVDEFQDTDPVQWDILQRAFHGHGPLVLIGDPKQAIYSFRGADVRSYLAACEVATDRATLSTNYRADGPLVAALDVLLSGLSLGEGIDVRPVRANHTTPRLRDADAVALPPFRLRTLAESTTTTRARALVGADVVVQVRRLLETGVTFADSDGTRTLNPSDIAVLVRTNHAGRDVTDALRRAGFPVAFTGSDSIYASQAANAWEDLLAAMANPRSTTVRAAMRTAFFGRTLADLARADEDTLGEWTAVIRRWDRLLSRDGVAALFTTITGETDFATRILASPGGERLMTDLRHLAQLMHETSLGDQPSAARLAEWLAGEIGSATAGSERTRRLETDSQAVQVKTIHKAKGLQFPVVLLPDLADWYQREDTDGRLMFHDATGRRVLDLGGKAADGRPERFAAHQREESEDSLRTLYVAMTRAHSQIICWWSRTWNTPASPLHRLLFRDRATGVPAMAYPLDRAPGNGDPHDLDWLVGQPGIRVEPVVPDVRPPAALPGPVWGPLSARTATRTIDRHWRRTSYSGLTAAVHAETGRLALPEVVGLVDDEPVESAEAGTTSVRSPMADLPGGTQFGTLVHALFEELDPLAIGPDREAILTRRLTDLAEVMLPRFPLPGVDPAALAGAVLPALLTPLGPLAGGRCLADFPLTDRLTELEFEMPTSDTSGTTLGALADLVQKHLSPADPLAAYPAALRDPALADQPLRGFLTGSIDAVLRCSGDSGQRFIVVDYKTNRLSTEDLRVGHYGAAAMAKAMVESHYPLQALLYSVALHRFLSGRLVGYDPGRHLGGVLYLFVRGMAGDASHGVFAWNPAPDLIVELSGLLSGTVLP